MHYIDCFPSGLAASIQTADIHCNYFWFLFNSPVSPRHPANEVNGWVRGCVWGAWEHGGWGAELLQPLLLYQNLQSIQSHTPLHSAAMEMRESLWAFFHFVCLIIQKKNNTNKNKNVNVVIIVAIICIIRQTEIKQHPSHWFTSLNHCDQTCKICMLIPLTFSLYVVQLIIVVNLET